MQFALFSLVANLPHPLTGEALTSTQKIENVIQQAVLAEELGFAAYGVGERHGAPFLSSSPPVLRYHAAFGHQVLSISVDGLTEAEQREQVERFAQEVAPALRRQIPNSVWQGVNEPAVAEPEGVVL